jgi:outer membrane usher protein
MRRQGLFLPAILAFSAMAPAVLAQPGPSRTLLLDVTINGRETGAVAQFTERGGALYAAPAELREIGLVVSREAEARAEGGLVPLAALPGLEARVEGRTQRLILTATHAALLPAVLATLGGPGAPLPHAERASLGAVFNYDLLATFTGGRNLASGFYEARVFDGFGIVSSSGLAYSDRLAPNQDQFVRLDTSWTYPEPEEMRRWRAGDLINFGLGWTRPVRMAGAQLRTDFGLRPDLVTFPLPTIASQTAVPSTVDVLVNGIRRLSEPVQPGPFELRQLPVVTGAGEVSVAVRDALGRETVTTLPFYASSSLLTPGLSAYAVQAGVVRRNYGLLSNDYGAGVASASLRHGLTDWLTLEGHAEGTESLFMGGGGAAVRIGTLGVLSLAGAGSGGGSGGGGFVQAGFERVSPLFSFGISAARSTAGFRDIAAATGSPQPRSSFRANLGIPFGPYGSFGLAYVEQRGGGETSTPFGRLRAADLSIASGSYSVALGDRVFAYATGFRSFEAERPWGVVFGVSLSLGNQASLTGYGSMESGRLTATAQASRSALAAGDAGFRLLEQEGRTSRRLAEADYLGTWGHAMVGVDQSDAQAAGRVGLRGAVTAAGGGVFLSDTVQDSFAVVRAGGAKGVGVLYENRRIGETDANGRLLVPYLRAWQANRLAIDPETLPLDAEPRTTRREVRPQERSGIVVDFGIRHGGAALLRLQDAAGRPLPMGGTATLAATGATAPVGHGGEVFLTGLGETNTLEVALPGGGHCRARFGFRAVPGDIPRIGPLPCLPAGEGR